MITVITMCFNCYGGNWSYSEEHFIKREHINSYYYSPLRHRRYSNRINHIDHTKRHKVKLQKLMVKLYENIIQLPYNAPTKRIFRRLMKQMQNEDIDIRIKYFYKPNTIKCYLQNSKKRSMKYTDILSRRYYFGEKQKK